MSHELDDHSLLNIKPGLYRNLVWHRRTAPKTNEFSYKTVSIWADADDPTSALAGLSANRRISPVQFRTTDFGDGTDATLGTQVRRTLSSAGLNSDVSSIRMLTQPRLWGWLFNPITFYLCFSESDLESCVLEVSNTPWKERHTYAVQLENSSGRFAARFDKQMHVSPFLEMNYVYDLEIDPKNKRFAIDVQEPGNNTETILNTEISSLTDPITSSLQTLGSTHKTSSAIHWQAARLTAKGVRFLKHPRKRS